MPPQHPQTDLVVHEVRSAPGARPALVRGTKDFFEAVAGTRSPINRQSSRIAAPFATNTFLGGGTTPTVSTPEQQAFISKGAAKKGNPQARTIEQTYVKAADTQKTIPAKTTPGARGGGPSIQGAALTAPNIQAVGTRALGLIGSGIPLGSAAPSALKALSSLGLGADQRQQVISGFAHDTTLDQPTTKAAEVALALAKGNAIPANPTKRQLLTAALSPHEHQPSYWDAVDPRNIIKDALYTPVYAAEGGFATGAATRAALGGNTAPIKAIGEAQLQQIEHPGAFVQQHPFQAALTVFGAAKGLGAVGGKVAGLEAAPRVVPATAFGDVPIPRGELSTNLTTRAGQNVSDFALGRSENLQKSALKTQTRKIANLTRIEQQHQLGASLKPLADAAKGISRKRQASLLYNEAQGATAPEFADFYRGLADQAKTGPKGRPVKPATAKRISAGQTAQANIRAAQGERFGTEVTPKEQAFLDAARNAAQTRTDLLKNMQTPAGTTALDPLSAQWRDYQHLVGLRASQGDPLAQAVTQARGRSVSTMPGTPEHAAANAALAKSLDAFSASTDAQPFRVPTVRPKPLSEFAFPGRSLRARNDPASVVSGIGKPSMGASLESGNYPLGSEHFYKQLEEPHTAAAMIEFTNRVSKELGTVPKAGDPIPDNMILRNEGNLRTTPKVNLTAADSLNAEADALRSMQDEFIDPVTAGITHVPEGFKGIMLPRPVYKEIIQRVARVQPGSLGAKISTATRAYKTGVLMTRPAYPAGNLANSGLQAALGGAGPLSWLRGRSLPSPAGVSDAGFIASEFRKSGRLGFRSGIDEARVTPGIAGKTGALAKGAGRFVAEQYTGRIRRYSIAADNAGRKALYASKAVKEARKGAYPDDGAIRRLIAKRRAADPAIQDYLHKMANGTDAEAKAAADRAVQTVNDFLGDFGSMGHLFGSREADLLVPFNRWLRFSSTLLLKTLPLKYPGRTLLLYRLGQLGQQGTAQQGILPQYLQESIPLTGNPAAEWLTNTQRANPFATLGTTLPPDQTTGAPDTSQIIGNFSPIVPLGINTITGKDIQTGRQLTNAQGEPITQNPLDQARYLGAQLTGLVPPIAALAGGTRGKADTSIPFIGEQSRKASSSGPLLQQPSQPWWLPIANQVLPVRLDIRNLHADQYNGAKLLTTYLAKKQELDNKAALGKPGGQAAVIAKWTKIGAEVNANLQRYLKNPKLVDELLASGTAGKTRG